MEWLLGGLAVSWLLSQAKGGEVPTAHKSDDDFFVPGGACQCPEGMVHAGMTIGGGCRDCVPMKASAPEAEGGPALLLQSEPQQAPPVRLLATAPADRPVAPRIIFRAPVATTTTPQPEPKLLQMSGYRRFR